MLNFETIGQLKWVLRTDEISPGLSIIWVYEGKLILQRYRVDYTTMGLLPNPSNCGLRMRWKCRERFSRHRGSAIPACTMARAWPLFYKKPMGFLSDSGHLRAVVHVVIAKWQFPVGGEENVPGIPGACATRNFTYLVKGPCHDGAGRFVRRWCQLL